MPNSPSDVHIRQLLTRGFIYLTAGTCEQIQWLFRNEQVKISVLWHPTTKEIIRATRTPSAEFLISRTQEILVIYPETLEAVGFKKSRTGKTPSQFAFPNDQFFKVSPHLFVFVICLDFEDKLDTKTKGEIKKLKGGPYKTLDLMKLTYTELEDSDRLQGDYSLFPMTWYEKLNCPLPVEPDSIEEITTTEFALVKGLLTIEGVQRWGRFNAEEIYKYFLLPDFEQTMLLSKARAWCLHKYLLPFIPALDDDTLNYPGALLMDFAYWVFCSCTYWVDDPKWQGLILTKSRKKDIEPFFTFRISKRAKEEWWRLVSKMPANQRLRDFRKC